jgi:hypothetical protein
MGPYGTETVTGVVRRETVAAGTKSERPALVLVAGDRRLRLRRRGAPAYGEDPELAALEDHRVTVTGTALSSTFLVDTWEPLPSS